MSEGESRTRLDGVRAFHHCPLLSVGGEPCQRRSLCLLIGSQMHSNDRSLTLPAAKILQLAQWYVVQSELLARSTSSMWNPDWSRRVAAVKSLIP
jgi:hypothetical protein